MRLLFVTLIDNVVPHVGGLRRFDAPRELSFLILLRINDLDS